MSRGGTPDAVWTPSAITASARALIEGGMDAVWVRGEVSGFRAYASGHWYFTLKDERAQVKCVMWKSHALRAGPPPEDGTELFAFAQPGLWEDKGEFRLTVSRLLATGDTGAEARAREAVRQRLADDGLLDPARKRPLPAFPRAIALVTSPDGAALRDMVQVARQRYPLVRLLLLPTRVQGAEAADEVVAALRRVARLPQVELCVIGRGGGAKEDLAVFDTEAVCRALAAVPVPTISAVGHETDIALTDLVADERAPTPSAAMEMALPDQDDVARHARQLGHRLAGGLRRRTRVAEERLRRSGDRLEGAMRRLALHTRGRLDRAGAALDALSPLAVLRRGFAVARADDGAVLRRAADFAPGRPFRLRVSDGEVAARAEGAS
ncbi:MAG: exodeoxyribonuclease VII large subunit [Gemmatimonadales bacterium]|nr:exodeoxyribonuclease VII large subunit [Gemmatimonadales bacterium]